MEVEGAGVGTLIARVFEFLLICGYFLFVDRKIGYRLKNLRMKCNSLIKDYVSISIPVFVSGFTACSWYFSGSNGYGKNRNGICIGKFNNSCYTAAYDRDNSGNLSRQLHYDRSHIGPW